MKLVGLTGGIATGKSTVAKLLQEYGVPVIDADKIYFKLSQNGNSVWNAVRRAFGEEYLLPDGEIDRKALGRLVFSDDRAREKLNSVTHPIVKDEMLKIMNEIKNRKDPKLIVMDVPLLFEAGWNQWMDEVWVVAVPEEMQLQRLMERDKITREEALLRIRSQMNIEEKKRMAHRVIDNSQSIYHTKTQIEKILEELRW